LVLAQPELLGRTAIVANEGDPELLADGELAVISVRWYVFGGHKQVQVCNYCDENAQADSADYRFAAAMSRRWLPA
jgi:hypothetical protein